MQIITVNIPQPLLSKIDSLCGEGPGKLYPSRSEFFRVALKKFLKQQLYSNSVQSTAQTQPQQTVDFSQIHVKCEKIQVPSHPGRHMLDVSEIHSLIQKL